MYDFTDFKGTLTYACTSRCLAMCSSMLKVAGLDSQPKIVRYAKLGGNWADVQVPIGPAIVAHVPPGGIYLGMEL